MVVVDLTSGTCYCCVKHLYLTEGFLHNLLRMHLAHNVNDRVPTVRESQGILSESGKVRENREGQGKVREF